MKTYALVVALLFLTSIVWAQPGGSDPPAGHAVEGGVAAGPGYRLTSQNWQVSGCASGGSYRLLVPAAPAQRGSGCCCTYLPIIGGD